MAYSIEIDLPDLAADAEIRASNIQATQPIYCAALLEGLRIFEVADLIVEYFLDGQLLLDQAGSSQLDRYAREQPNRLTERERHRLYSLAFGMPGGGELEPRSNRDFDDHWARFLVAVDDLVRENPNPGPGMPRGSHHTAKQAARDLATNLSLYGYGIGRFAAVRVQSDLQDLLGLLAMPSLVDAFGARDIWQLIDRVVSMELGGATNLRRYRTMAMAGGVVIGWLARRVEVITSPGPDLVDLSRLGEPPSTSPMTSPTDRDLVDACRYWLEAVMMGSEPGVMAV